MDRGIYRVLFCAVLLCCGAVQAQTMADSLRSGDLLFVRDMGGMGQAVSEATGEYTHVALVERDGDSLFVIDATPDLGVARRPLTTDNWPLTTIDVYRLSVPFDTADVLRRAHALLGCPYDSTFLPSNNAYYCSELIQAVFIIDGELMFHSSPMNWRDAKGRMPRYWRRHFKRLGMKVPEGVPGTNPTGLARSPILRILRKL